MDKDIPYARRNYFLHLHISFRNRDRQLFKCLHLPHTETWRYRENTVTLHVLWLSAQVVWHVSGIQLPFSVGKMPEMPCEAFRTVSADWSSERHSLCNDRVDSWDDNYFYINVNNEDLHMIPKGDFTMGTPGEFREFMERKTEKLFQPVKLSWKAKFFILKQALEDKRNDADVKK